MSELFDLKGEIWKNIIDFEGYYEISNYGRVKAVERSDYTTRGIRKYKARILKPGEHTRGYKFVNLSKDRKTTYKSVHRLVALHFISNHENKPQVNHIDGNVRNNHVDNLEWNTNSENNKHAYKNLGRKSAKGMTGFTGSKNIQSKIVYQFSLDGEFITSYESTHEAAKITGFKQAGISSAARGRYQKSHGFKWSYNKN